ncbi:MAG: thioesterase [Oscillospiraceae bacterium]|jgi:medium-chain acyl-[acyl-carrier-protein] hydrolase|nr:thioesterase [Oscillospiraceae bacterium]MDD3261519.1 thioesterase [Oscillospiraceae bacterium]
MQKTVGASQSAGFERTVRVESHQIGASGKMRLSALLRMEQETGEEHMDQVGLGYEKMLQDGIVLLITENSVRLQRMPVRNEQLRIVTNALGAVGVHLYREFLFYSGEEKVADIMQASVCVDSKTHRPLRPQKAIFKYNVFPDNIVPQEKQVPKIRVNEDLPLLGERPVRYSDLDMNHHLTNTIYGDIVEDFLPEEYRAWQQVHISYMAEAVLGDMLQIQGERRKNGFLLSGRKQGIRSFSALVQC